MADTWKITLQTEANSGPLRQVGTEAIRVEGAARSLNAELQKGGTEDYSKTTSSLRLLASEGRRAESELKRLGALEITPRINTQGLGQKFTDNLYNSVRDIGDFIAIGIGEGLDRLQSKESSTQAIAAVIKTFEGAKFTSFNSALAEAYIRLKALDQQAATSSATATELRTAYTSNLGNLFSGGIRDMEQQVLLLDQLTKAVKVLVPGAGTDQVNSEIKALLTGDQLDNSGVASSLTIKPEDIKNAREAGTLFQLLIDKTKEFKNIGGDSMESVRGNLEEAIGSAKETLAQPLFDTLKKGAADFAAVIARDDVKGKLAELGVTIGSVAKTGLELTQWAIQHAPALLRVAQALGTVGAAYAAVKITAYLAGLVSSGVAMARNNVLWASNTAVVGANTAALNANAVAAGTAATANTAAATAAGATAGTAAATGFKGFFKAGIANLGPIVITAVVSYQLSKSILDATGGTKVLETLGEKLPFLGSDEENNRSNSALRAAYQAEQAVYAARTRAELERAVTLAGQIRSSLGADTSEGQRMGKLIGRYGDPSQAEAVLAELQKRRDAQTAEERAAEERNRQAAERVSDPAGGSTAVAEQRQAFLDQARAALDPEQTEMIILARAIKTARDELSRALGDITSATKEQLLSALEGGKRKDGKDLTEKESQAITILIGKLSQQEEKQKSLDDKKKKSVEDANRQHEEAAQRELELEARMLKAKGDLRAAADKEEEARVRQLADQIQRDQPSLSRPEAIAKAAPVIQAERTASEARDGEKDDLRETRRAELQREIQDETAIAEARLQAARRVAASGVPRGESFDSLVDRDLRVQAAELEAKAGKLVKDYEEAGLAYGARAYELARQRLTAEQEVTNLKDRQAQSLGLVERLNNEARRRGLEDGGIRGFSFRQQSATRPFAGLAGFDALQNQLRDNQPIAASFATPSRLNEFYAAQPRKDNSDALVKQASQAVGNAGQDVAGAVATLGTSITGILSGLSSQVQQLSRTVEAQGQTIRNQRD